MALRDRRLRHIDLFIDAAPAGTVDFKLTVKITLDAAKVAIENARFMALHVGSFKFKGTLLCEGVTLIERTSKDYTPPGTISFGEGIPIIAL